MKTLILMRHAKTETTAISGQDFDRQLTDEGRKYALKAGKLIDKETGSPGMLIASAAERTKTTALLVQEGCGGQLHVLKSLYNASARDIVHHIQSLTDDSKSVLYVLHNPGVSDAASSLSGEWIELKPGDFVLFKLKNKSWKEKPDVHSFRHYRIKEV